MVPIWVRPDTGLRCLAYQQTGAPVAPVLSVLMPVYNGARFLDQAVASILNQTFRNFELVVVDDGSRDATPRLLHRWVARDPRVRVLRQPHLGLIEALNTGWLACRAPVIARMDADDLSVPNRLERQYGLLADRPDLGVVTCAATLIDEVGRELGTTGNWSPDAGLIAFLPANPIVHGSVMVRRSSVPTEPPYREAPEDYWLWIELLAQGVKFAHIQEPLYKFRVHGGRFSVWSARSQLRGVMHVQLELLRKLGQAGAPRDVLAAAWESVAVAAHVNGRKRLASRAHRVSERLREACPAEPESLHRAVEAYGWARMPWHWYHEKAIRLLQADRSYQACRKIVLNHPLLAWTTRLPAALRQRRHGRRIRSGRAASVRPLAMLPVPRVLHGARVLVIGQPDRRTWSRIVQAGPAEVTLAHPCAETEPTPPPEQHCPFPVRLRAGPVDPTVFDIVIRLDDWPCRTSRTGGGCKQGEADRC